MPRPRKRQRKDSSSDADSSGLWDRSWGDEEQEEAVRAPAPTCSGPGATRPPDVSAAEDTPIAAKLEAEATALAEAGRNLRRAAQLFEKAVRFAAAEDAPRLQEARAQCLLALGQTDAAAAAEAVAAATEAVKAVPDWPSAQLTLARALRNVGKLQDAADVLVALLKLFRADSADRSGLKHEVEIERMETMTLLEQHWESHHDVKVQLEPLADGRPGSKPEQLRIRQSLDCAYCRLAEEETGPGGTVWPAAVVLSCFIGCRAPPAAFSARAAFARCRSHSGAHPQCRGWSSLHLLELGAGTGLAGLAAAAAGAEVLMTDRACCLPVMRLNLELNRERVTRDAGRAACATFDWLEAPSPEVVQGAPWDGIIAADLAYSFASIVPLAVPWRGRGDLGIASAAL
eukprot:TRINITY_DN18854_c0_g1_i5.p1 TRINITY_DN18854_c0_g1~~TRINITY_DN18854_c0_g1_i5.p1  ORF type:complete len:401 (+),score=74.63 TRINITY_DN18854_c0_g1_i5:185-1387(+)